MNYTLSTPGEIEEKIMSPLKALVNAADQQGIPIELSKQIVKIFNENYPWNKSLDPLWAGYIRDWHALITSKILKKTNLIDAEEAIGNASDLCKEITDDQICRLYSDFLNIFLSKKMPGGISEEGIISDHCCLAAAKKFSCISITTATDFKKIKFPWLIIYDNLLPTDGDHPFVPPVNWRKSKIPARGTSHGFLDAKGVEWVWDTLHKDHWDVQDGSPYKNVTPEGKILPRKNT